MHRFTLYKNLFQSANFYSQLRLIPDMVVGNPVKFRNDFAIVEAIHTNLTYMSSISGKVTMISEILTPFTKTPCISNKPKGISY